MTERQKILIVDDHENNLFALEKILEELDIEIIQALNGDEALRASLNHDFSLAILDVQMPGMDGFELAQFLRDDPKTEQLPIIFLSGVLTQDRDAFKGYEAGAIDYITKPCDSVILLCKVRVFLELEHQRFELDRQRLLLEEANGELRSFAYTVSHDLHAPLRRMHSFSNVLLEDYAGQFDEAGNRYLRRVQEGSQMMTELVEDMLKLSRVTEDELDNGEVDLSALALEVSQGLQDAAPERNDAFDVAPGITAVGDARLLRVVLENLLGNAWKYTSKQDSAEIEFGTTDQDGEKVFFVRDDGAGFDMIDADKLFQPFKRLHTEAEFAGTGIGLATVARVIDRHSGRVWAESVIDEGTTMYFTL